MSVCGSACLSICEYNSGTTRTIFTKYLERVAYVCGSSFSGMFTIGRIACRWEGVFFPIKNCIIGWESGWECTARAKYAIYDCLVLCCSTFLLIGECMLLLC